MKPTPAPTIEPQERISSLRAALRCRWADFAFAGWLCAGLLPAALGSAEPPVVPVGLDAYRQWERWPYQRIGVRAYMRSTYDRRGRNEHADASHFLYQLADDNNVTLDVAGPGILYFARYNHWHGSPWRYVVDGTEHLVQESSTATPTQPVENSVFLPAGLFPPPLAWTWSATKGADLIWTPIPFERSFRMGYSRTCYGTGYYIYHQWVPGTKLSQPLRAWDGKTPPGQDVLDLVGKAGTDLLPASGTPAARRLGLVEQRGTLAVPTTGTVPVLWLTNAPSVLRAVEFSVPRDQAIVFGRARLRVTWDGRSEPSVDAPVALLFGAGTLYNRDDREFLVKAFPVHIRFDAERVHLACFFPMPFFSSARIELAGNGETNVAGIQWRVRHAPFVDPPEHVGYFHATCRDHGEPKSGEDLVLLDTRGAEGSRDWSGSFIGTSFIFSDRAVLSTLEGDPHFFFDDSQTPQAYGTGTEEWGGGGDYWGGRNMTLPFAGHPVGARNLPEAKNAEDRIQSAYRFLLADLMPFGKNALIRLEHGGENQSTEHYRTVTYWYGRPGATLRQTDSLQLGESASEQAHGYLSPDASAPYEITSRYEWGPDSVDRGFGSPRHDAPDCAEFEFQAEAGKTYYVWVRGRNEDTNANSTSCWLSFEEAGGAPGAARKRMVAGNWSDHFPTREYGWSGSTPEDPPLTVAFTKSGRHKLRIQPRVSPSYLEGIWLSTTQKDPPAGPLRPAAGLAEIVLTANDTLAIRGQVRRVADSRTATGTALVIDGDVTGAVFYPPHTDRGRKTAGQSEFTLNLDPRNHGVLLRRKLDYSLPNQRAEVFVADGSDTNRQPTDWKPAGVWYLAGGNTCVMSRPGGELGATQHIVQTSNRRFRDDEFLLPRELTAGRTAIRVRVKFTPANLPLLPGRPLSEQAWSEIRYDAYCWVLP